MNPKLENITIISLPFILTSVLLVVGYNILISTTPEANIAPPADQSTTEILTKSDFPTNPPSKPYSNQITLVIATVPDNTPALNQITSLAVSAQADGIYLSLPIAVNPDNSLTLSQATSSSEENVMRWVKKTISTANQKQLHTTLALTLNAQTTITDSKTFSTNLNEFIIPWASLATEYSIRFFSPGITMGHPLYSNLTNQEFNQLLSTVQSTIRKKYSGQIGVGMCCSISPDFRPGGYTFITAISTPEFTLPDLLPQINLYTKTYNMKHTFEYNRETQKVLQVLTP
ncbi:hypothetical protein ACFL2V_07090 [Pseudomonadota bacterium]